MPDPDPLGTPERAIFYALSDGEATPALTLGQTYPKERNGMECFNYWRQAIRDGEWTHPAKGFTVKVDAAQRQQWESNFRRMQRLGDEVPVVKDHKDHDADATLGYVVDVRQNGPWYEELHQYLGEKAKDTALKNKLSVGIDPDYTDVKRNKYGSAIVHSAITSRPVIPGQGDAVLAASVNDAAAIPERFYLTLATPTNPTGSAAAAPVVVTPSTAIPLAAHPVSRSPDMATLNCSEEHLSTLRALLPSGEALTADTAVGAVIQELQRLSAHAEADAGGPEVIAKMSRADVIDTAVKNRKAVKDSEQRLAVETTKLRGDLAELSKRVPKALDPEAEAAMVDAVRVKFDNAASRGAINPATKERLLSLLVKDKAGKVNTLALSRAANPTGNRALALELADILQDNRPVELGEGTGLQVLARVAPGDEKSEGEKQKEAAVTMLNKHLAGKGAAV